MKISQELLNELLTVNGTSCLPQRLRDELRAEGITWNKKGWKRKAILYYGLLPEYNAAKRAKKIARKKAARPNKINANRRRQAVGLNEPFIPYRPPGKDGFYKSWEWKKARFITIKRYGPTCMCCGSTERIVVDHILPRRKRPDLELDLENLQVLCNDCNMGKSWDDTTDFRPESKELSEEELDQIRLVYDSSIKL